jgi:hypothetical protein
MAFNNMRVFVSKELENNHELKRQRNEALFQKEETCREKTIIAKLLEEALRLEEKARKDLTPLKLRKKIVEFVVKTVNLQRRLFL